MVKSYYSESMLFQCVRLEGLPLVYVLLMGATGVGGLGPQFLWRGFLTGYLGIRKAIKRQTKPHDGKGTGQEIQVSSLFFWP